MLQNYTPVVAVSKPDRRDAGCSGTAGADSDTPFVEFVNGLAASAAVLCSHGLGGAGISSQ